MFTFLKKKFSKIEGECLQCGKCCQNIILFHRGRTIKTIGQFEKLVKKNPFYEHFNLIYKDKKNGYLYFSCDKLGSDGKCTDHENRPEICRKYPRSKIFFYGGNLLQGCGYYIKPEKTFSKILKKELKR